MSDSDLLRQYTAGSQSAFAELVKRHLNLVYGAALRQVRDPGLAEDVTQQVFISLSHKAPRLIGHKVLAAWLYDVTRFTALDALKARARRLRHERKAAQMAAQRSLEQPRPLEWNQLDPVLDRAMSQLSGTDRTILLLRFWQEQSTGEIAAALGISDDSARKRLFRATERLRKLLAGEGAPVSAAALSPLLFSNVLPQAPTHLTAKILTGAAAKVAVPGSAAAAKGTGILMATFKTKAVAVAIVAIAALGGSVYVGKKFIASDVAASNPTASDGQETLTRAPTDAGWRSRFDSVYSLGPGEAVKHISRPFIRERATYFNTVEKPMFNVDYSQVPWITFTWDGSLHRNMMSTGKASAGSLLIDGLGMRAYQVEGPVDLWKTPLPGDLICRTSATPDERMRAFGSVLSSSLGKPIRFEKKHVVRDAIVLQGNFAPVKGSDGKTAIIQFAPGPLKPPARHANLTAGSNIDTYCSDLEQQARMQVVNQLNGPRYSYRGTSEHTVDLMPADISHHPEQLQSLLSNLSSQTGASYTLEPREIDVWVWIEG